MRVRRFWIAVLTALINLNGSVAALLPVVVVMAVRLARPPSQLLMPMVFAGHAGPLDCGGDFWVAADHAVMLRSLQSRKYARPLLTLTTPRARGCPRRRRVRR